MNAKSLSLTVPYVFQTREERIARNVLHPLLCRHTTAHQGVFKKCRTNKRGYLILKENEISN